MSEMPIGVFAAFSVGKWNNADDYSLTVMQRPGGPDDPYGGYKEAKPDGIPLHIDEVRFEGEKVEYEKDGDMKSYWDESDGGPYRVYPPQDGVIEIEEV